MEKCVSKIKSHCYGCLGIAATVEGDPKVKLGYPSSFYYFSVQIVV